MLEGERNKDAGVNADAFVLDKRSVGIFDDKTHLPHAILFYGKESDFNAIMAKGDHFGKSFQDVVTHELGHSLYLRLPSSKRRDWDAVYESSKDWMSVRGQDNAEEGFAESVSNYLGTGNAFSATSFLETLSTVSRAKASSDGYVVISVKSPSDELFNIVVP